MSWIVFSLLAQFFWAITNIIDKFILSKWIKQPLVALFVFALVGFASSVLIFFARGFSATPTGVLLVALVAGLLYILANLLYMKALQTEEVSRVISLLYLDPLFTAILSAILLGEIFGVSKYVGVGAMVAGAMLIFYKRGKGFHLSTGVVYAIVAAFVYASYNLFLKHLLAQTDFWTTFAYIRIGTFLGMIPLLPWYLKPLMSLASKPKQMTIVIFGNALGMLGILFFTISVAVGFVTLATSLTAIQPLTVLVLSTLLTIFFPHIIKEEGGRGTFLQKLVAIILMFVGAILVIR